MASGTLVIRTDASHQIGTGHFMRCLALAQAWQDEGLKALFVSAETTPTLRSRLSDEGINEFLLPDTKPGGLEDAQETTDIAEKSGAQWIVLDGYHFGSTFQEYLKKAGYRLLAWDDHGHAEHYYADLILNQNLHAKAQLYDSREPYSQLLLGPSYAVLRREFISWGNWKREFPEKAKNILVTMGGSDPDNVTLRVIQALELIDIEDQKLVIVVGSGNLHYQSLEKAIADRRELIQIERDVKTMPALMAWADLAISAAGSTSWELAFMGLPSILVSIADNQVSVAAELESRKCAVNLGWHAAISPAQMATAMTTLIGNRQARRKLSEQSRCLIDGLGVYRVVQELRNGNLFLRRASVNDSRLIWEWANDSQTRSASFSSALIDWEDHQQWFESKLADPDSILFVAEDKLGIVVGHVRFQIEEYEATISVNISPDHRGCGYGWRVIQSSSQLASRICQLSTVHAFIKPDNIASLRSFSKAGYVELGNVQVGSHTALHYEWRSKSS